MLTLLARVPCTREAFGHLDVRMCIAPRDC
jgi:hypothetical protein